MLGLSRQKVKRLDMNILTVEKQIQIISSLVVGCSFVGSRA